MAEPQFSVRSAKARDLAHRLTRRENRSIADVVERALEAYELREAGREPASSFYNRISVNYGTDIDLEAVIRSGRSRDPKQSPRRSRAGSLIFLDTNVVYETFRKSPDQAVVAWLIQHDAELALPTVTIAEVAYGIQKILPDRRRATRLEAGLSNWRHRMAVVSQHAI